MEHYNCLDAVKNCRTDVIFVLDSSGSAGRGNWDLLVDVIAEFVTEFGIQGDSTRVGVVTYSSKVADSFNLDAYSSTDSLQQAISSLPFTVGSTNTAAALQHVRTNMLTSEAGDRSFAPNLVLVLTDGYSNDPTATMVSIQIVQLKQ